MANAEGRCVVVGIHDGTVDGVGTGQVAELARPTASRHLQALRELDLVSWEGQGPKDPRAS